MPTGASPAPPPPPRSKVKRKAPKPPVQQPFADDPYGQGIPGANPYGFTSYDPDQAAPYEDAFDEQPVGCSGFADGLLLGALRWLCADGGGLVLAVSRPGPVLLLRSHACEGAAISISLLRPRAVQPAPKLNLTSVAQVS